MISIKNDSNYPLSLKLQQAEIKQLEEILRKYKIVYTDCFVIQKMCSKLNNIPSDIYVVIYSL